MEYQYNQQQILDGGVVTYRTEQDVYTFPVAPGYRVTFVNSGSDVVFRKTFFPQNPQPMIERLIMVPDKQQNAISQQLYTGEIAGLNRSFAEQTANAQGFNQLQGQLAQYCCDQRLATCQTQNLIQSEAALTRSNCDANAQKMMDKLCQLELDGIRRDYENRLTTIQNALDAERSANQALRFAASQGAQTATIQAGQRALANEVEQYVLPTPRPAYVVANPNCCQQNTCPQNQCCA